MSSHLLDTNVLVALVVREHTFHRAAHRWLTSLMLTDELLLCRQTQLGLFRLLANTSVVGTAKLSMDRCWLLQDEILRWPRIRFAEEPAGTDPIFRLLARGSESSPKRWNDDYLLAIAIAAGATLVTFDKAIASRSDRTILLQL